MSTVSQRSFTGGEITPSMYSRVDFAKYQTSLKKCKNFIPLKYGGVDNRSGTLFTDEVLDHAADYRLIPFQGSSANAVLEIRGSSTNLLLRVYEDGSLVFDTPNFLTITNITGTNPVVVTTFAGNPTGLFKIENVVGSIASEVNGKLFSFASLSPTTFELKEVDGSAFVATGSYTSGGIVTSQYSTSTSLLDAQGNPVSLTDLSKVKYAQSGDVLVLSSSEFRTIYLKRNGYADWTFTSNEYSIFSSVGYTGNVVVTTFGAAGTTTYRYCVSPVYGSVAGPAIQATFPATPTGRASITTGNATLSAANYNIITISGTVGDFDLYNIYKESPAGIFGLIGQTTSSVFNDVGYTPDASNTFPDVYFDIKTAGAVGFVQQRLFFGDITWVDIPRKNGIALNRTERETVAGSALGQFATFTKNGTITDYSSLSFVAATKKFSPPRHILDLSKMVVMTENSELVINGDGSPITATNLSVKANSYNGCSHVPPIVMNETCLYLQARGNVVRDLTFDFNIDGFSGNEISIFASHLFEGYEILDWCYQQHPNSNIWAVRDDGKLLCLTYLREQMVLAWSQHELDGARVLSVAAIPEGDEDTVYMLVERTIDGVVKKHVERLSSRFIDKEITKDVITGSSTESTRTYSGLAEAVFVDSALIYDGRNFDTAKKVRVTTAGTVDDLLTLESNTSGTFTATDVGNYVYIYFNDIQYRCLISSYTNSTTVSVYPMKDIPADIANIYTSDYSIAVDQVSGLEHLEGKQVSVTADGFVIANPNNPAYEVLTVTNGSITLPEDEAGEYIIVGLPYLSDLQTLRIDTAQSETLSDKKMLITKVSMGLKDTRGLWAGSEEPTDVVDGLYEMKARNNERYDSPIDLKTDVDFIEIDATYNNNGSVFIRQVDPVPATILSVHPTGAIPFGRG